MRTHGILALMATGHLATGWRSSKGGIFFPARTYRVSRVTTPGGRWSLELNGERNFLSKGKVPKSMVKLMDTSAATGEFIPRNAWP